MTLPKGEINKQDAKEIRSILNGMSRETLFVIWLGIRWGTEEKYRDHEKMQTTNEYHENLTNRQIVNRIMEMDWVVKG